MPSGPGVIGEETIAEIARDVPEGVATFLLTARTRAEEIAAQQRRTGVDTLQLVDRVDPSELDRLRATLPGVMLVQVIHVRDEAAMDDARQVAPLVDAILLDSGNPDLAIKELGGTGRVHDWQVSRRIVEEVDVPVYLAGGLNAENVRRAIDAVHPYGLDLCSGVRTGGALDEILLASFMRAAGAAAIGEPESP